MKTKMVEKSSLFPKFIGSENIVYKATEGGENKTIYQKFIEDSSNLIMQYA